MDFDTTALLAHVTSDQETGPVLRLCYDLGVEDVARLSGGEVNGRHSSLVFLNGSIVGATGCVVVCQCIQSSKDMFCMVCGFRVRVWESCRTSRSFVYGYKDVTELAQVPGNVAREYGTRRSSGRVQNCCTRTPGSAALGVQNSQKFRVLV